MNSSQNYKFIMVPIMSVMNLSLRQRKQFVSCAIIFTINVYMALGIDSYWNVKNLKGIRPKDKKSLCFETYNLLENEGSGDSPFDKALPYKLACMP